MDAMMLSQFFAWKILNSLSNFHGVLWSADTSKGYPTYSASGFVSHYDNAYGVNSITKFDIPGEEKQKLWFSVLMSTVIIFPFLWERKHRFL